MSLAGLTCRNYIKINVSDTGAGIAPEIIGSIFEPYFTTKKPGEGTGMGLAMVHGIVTAYGGEITVNSTLGLGTTFTLYLPVSGKGNADVLYQSEDLPKGTERILFVDDEAPIVKMGSQILERLGYSVTTRTGSVKALELFRAKPDEFDLVITDMTMPDMTGDQLAAELMKIRPTLPIVICSGYSNRLSDQSAQKLGIKAFSHKPIVKADLAKTVRDVLDGKN
jgi:CheY-like chemotaxis protein